MKLPEAQYGPQELLRKLPCACDFSDGAIKQLAAIASVREIDEGTLLFAEGEQHSRLYFICEGTIRLEMLTAKCGRQTILSLGSGDLLGWSALFGDGVMTATAIAAADTVVVAFESQDLQRLLEKEPVCGYHFMRVVAQSLSRRLLATRLQLLDLYHH